MDAHAIIEALAPLAPGAPLEAGASVDFATLYVPADRLVETCLRRRPLRVTFPWRMVPLLWLFMLPRRIRLWLT